MMPRLGVNIDHVATLRQARGESYPSIIRATEEVILFGANQVTVHLREDRRHIQEDDVEKIRIITAKQNIPLNLEIACSQEMQAITRKYAPDWICIVPERREERTTEGGLNLINEETWIKVSNACNKLKKDNSKLKISLFLESNQKILQKASLLPIDAVEIHTGEYAKFFNAGKDIKKFIESFQKSQVFLQKNSIACHGGHGLTNQNIVPLLKSRCFEEYNIGHWIIADSIFRGLGTVVRELKVLFEESVI